MDHYCEKCTKKLFKVNDITLYCDGCEDVIIEGHPIYNLNEELINYYNNPDY